MDEGKRIEGIECSGDTGYTKMPAFSARTKEDFLDHFDGTSAEEATEQARSSFVLELICSEC